MDNLAAARSQMGISLAFHIIFAVIGVALPLMMTIAEWRFRATGDAAYPLLAKRWARGTTVLFAVAAVSGAVLSFELGVFWPQFMQYAGAVVGMPFSLEGLAFFTEAIFSGTKYHRLYLRRTKTCMSNFLPGQLAALPPCVSA